MRHIGIFSNSGDVQTAIEQETLLNPYVALVSGVVDFNTVTPTPPVEYLGVWQYNQQLSTYVFTVEEENPSYWASEPKIATVMVELYGKWVEANLTLKYDSSAIEFKLKPEVGNDESGISFDGQGEQDFPEVSLVQGAVDSDAVLLHVQYDGLLSFTFSAYDPQGQYPSFVLNMNTINPIKQ